MHARVSPLLIIVTMPIMMCDLIVFVKEQVATILTLKQVVQVATIWWCIEGSYVLPLYRNMSLLSGLSLSLLGARSSIILIIIIVSILKAQLWRSLICGRGG